MKFSTTIAVIATLFAPIVLADTLAYDTVYDNGSNSLDIVACSDGENGLETSGYTTFSSLPKFPYVGAVGAVAGWNSPNCGTCWNVTYTNSKNVSKTLSILAIDVSGGGFVLGQKTMDELTGGQAVALGRVNVVSAQVNVTLCGLT